MKLKELIKQITKQCEDYHFCEEGVNEVLQADCVTKFIAILRENIFWCFESEYHQAIADNIETWYRQWKEEFNRCGIWVNENIPDEIGIIICTTSFPDITIFGNGFVGHCLHGSERCFIFGEKKFGVISYGHSRVYSKNPNARFILANHSHGFIFHSSEVIVREDAIGYIEDSHVNCHGRCKLVLTNDCQLKDNGHVSLEYVGHIGI